MSKAIDPRPFLEDILDSIGYVESYTSGMSLQEFMKNSMVQDAVVRRIEIIGEAVGKLPDYLKDNHPGIPWQDVKDMRNKLIHDYGHVDLELVWAVVQKELPALKANILEITNSL